MVGNKLDFLKSFMPESITHIESAQINLDFTDLTLADILRNLNKVYPKNSRNRNAIASGTMVAAVLCKTESLEPMNGLFIVLTNDDLTFEIVSKNYIVVCISESNIVSDTAIMNVIARITKYIVSEFKNSVTNFADFYAKYIYDPSELEAEDDGVNLPRTMDYLLE